MPAPVAPPVRSRTPTGRPPRRGGVRRFSRPARLRAGSRSRPGTGPGSTRTSPRSGSSGRAATATWPGIDEVGRGCLAGPVTAAAVILPPDWQPRGLRDSKLLKPEERRRLDVEIRRHAVAWSIAFVSPELIDRINILQATLLASTLAAARLPIRPDALLLDAVSLPEVRVHQRVLVSADRLCASVAAASVIAKVARDRLMEELRRRLSGLRPGRQQGLRRARASGRPGGARPLPDPPALVRAVP